MYEIAHLLSVSDAAIDSTQSVDIELVHSRQYNQIYKQINSEIHIKNLPGWYATAVREIKLSW